MYIELIFTVKESIEENGEIAASLLNDLGFETVQEKEKLQAYIAEDLLSAEEIEAQIEQLVNFKLVDNQPLQAIVKKENWNKLWESNFNPITIENICHIRADFHPALNGEIQEIIINPKMSFGTGHHATTYLAIKMLNELDLENKRCLDMGTGTGILAIFAVKSKAAYALAIDNDDWSVENSIENVHINQVHEKIDVMLGDAYHIAQETCFDVIVANINRNILLRDLEAYIQKLKPTGNLIISGFYSQDIPVLMEKITALGLKQVQQFERDNWVCLCCQF